ncbi:hypothetical protein TIFTF001_014972 [Ficus carica]|uniref:Uncharacterized protein n=1 Tax=Ficus carica TaxID=3494 RepID=A0AA88A4Y8_FICCA|nr:hypothetical protein TIFTF001_014972 [Ficus carica]
MNTKSLQPCKGQNQQGLKSHGKEPASGACSANGRDMCAKLRSERHVRLGNRLPVRSLQRSLLDRQVQAKIEGLKTPASESPSASSLRSVRGVVKRMHLSRLI